MSSNKQITKRVRSQEGQEVISVNKQQKINSSEYSKRYREKKKQELIDLQEKYESLGEANQKLIIEHFDLQKKNASLDEENQKLSIENTSLRDKIQKLVFEKDSLNLNWMMFFISISSSNQELNENVPFSLDQNLNTFL
ncbi:13499_t:CDS:2 [Ambispora gerdemannii]|uniref:13499_t:CDS:1 n=1 Tax=Ambispora gerdemannii TaxID=144530 RepID=A0A9N9FFC5_9GLOM|nr:13499_t:CDS:2 [Ambispora gerdemannii]